MLPQTGDFIELSIEDVLAMQQAQPVVKVAFVDNILLQLAALGSMKFQQCRHLVLERATNGHFVQYGCAKGHADCPSVPRDKWFAWDCRLENKCLEYTAGIPKEIPFSEPVQQAVNELSVEETNLISVEDSVLPVEESTVETTPSISKEIATASGMSKRSGVGEVVEAQVSGRKAHIQSLGSHGRASDVLAVKYTEKPKKIAIPLSALRSVEFPIENGDEVCSPNASGGGSTRLAKGEVRRGLNSPVKRFTI